MTKERKMIAWGTQARWIGAVVGAVLSASLPAEAQLGALGNQLLHQDSPGILETAEPDDTFGRPLAAGDFNGNGIDDLAIGVPFEDLEGIGVDRAGIVQVLYGAAGGLSDTDQLWSQDSPGVQGSPETDDFFGSALAAGDFDDDGFDDLAIGVSAEDVGSIQDAGVVQVLYGGPLGLSATGNQLWHQSIAGIGGSAEAGDRFGGVLAAGDFDNDGFDDLAIGVAGEDIGTIADAGAVQILFGSIAGLSEAGNQLWHQDSLNIADNAEASDYFGRRLATGDFDNDGFADLAVTVSGEDVGGVLDAGAVQVLYGNLQGLDAAGNQLWHQDSSGIPDDPEQEEQFGRALSAGDFDGDGFDELAIGVRNETIGGVVEAGAVHVLYGAPGGLGTLGNQFWHQDSPGMPTTVEEGDTFGGRLSAGDFDGDGFFDLAVGVTAENVNSALEAGAVQILYGTSGGLSTAGNQFWHQDSLGILDVAETRDYFGLALAVGDFNGGGVDDLAIGVPWEDVLALQDDGAVQVLYSLTLFTDGFESGDASSWSASVP